MFDHQHLNQLYQYCYSLTANEADAYDLLHTALEKWLRSNHQGSTTAIAYVRTIIRNQFIDQYRKQQRFPEESLEEQNAGGHGGELQVPDLSLLPLEQTIINERDLADLWQLLTLKERELLYLWAVEGYSIDEISREQDCPRGTLLARIHRLRKKIARHQQQNLPQTMRRQDG